MQNKEKPHAMSVFLSISNYAADLRTQAWVDKSLLANKNHRNWSIAYIQPLRLGKLKTLLRSLKAYLSLSSFLSDDSKSLKRYLGPKESKSLTVTVTGARLLEFIVVCIRTFLFSNAAAVVAILYSVLNYCSHAQHFCCCFFAGKSYATQLDRNFHSTRENYPKNICVKRLKTIRLQYTSSPAFAKCFCTFINYLLVDSIGCFIVKESCDSILSNYIKL